MKFRYLIPIMLLFCVVSVHADYVDDMRDNIDAYWKMEDNNSPIVDALSDYNMTCAGCNYSITGKISTGIDFPNNVNPDTGFDTDGSSSYSMGCWVNPDANEGNVFGTANGGYKNLYVGETNSKCTDNKFCHSVFDGNWDTAISSTSWSAGSWYLVVATYDGSNISIWVNDGGIEGTIDSSGPSLVKDISIGGLVTDNTQYFDGQLDECFYFKDYALNQSQIEFMYNSGTPYAYNQYPFENGWLNITKIVCISPTPDDNSSPYETYDPTPTFNFSTDRNASCRISDEDLGYADMTHDCDTNGSLTHLCTLDNSDILSTGTQYVYLACDDGLYPHNSTTNYDLEMLIWGASSSNSTASIEQGISNSVIGQGATIYSDQQVYLRNLNDDQIVATVDRVAVYGNQRWLLNYENQTPLGLFNISPVVYVLDATNTTGTDLQQRVTTLIDSTKN